MPHLNPPSILVNMCASHLPTADGQGTALLIIPMNEFWRPPVLNQAVTRRQRVPFAGIWTASSHRLKRLRMDIRTLSSAYAVSPQISVEDIPAIVEAGVALVICNRPDSEVPPSHQAETIGVAVRDAGIAFEVLPLTHQTMTPENINRQAELIGAANGPVLAYCASGTRCSVIWALDQVKTRTPDDVLSDLASAGYQLDALRPTLQQMHDA